MKKHLNEMSLNICSKKIPKKFINLKRVVFVSCNLLKRSFSLVIFSSQESRDRIGFPGRVRDREIARLPKRLPGGARRSVRLQSRAVALLRHPRVPAQRSVLEPTSMGVFQIGREHRGQRVSGCVRFCAARQQM